MIGETNINGGAGLNGKGALLKIKSQTGSTITVSKGSYSKIVETNLIIDEDFSYWFFQTEDFGEWTITGVLGEDNDIQTIIINDNKKYDIELTYNLYIIKNGQLLSPYTITKVESGTLEQFSDRYKWTCKSNPGGLSVNNLANTPDRYNYIIFTGNIHCNSGRWSLMPNQMATDSFPNSESATRYMEVTPYLANLANLFFWTASSGNYIEFFEMYFSKRAPV